MSILQRFARTGLLEHDDVRKMLASENGGFPLIAQVRIAARDRAALYRLLRHCACPPALRA
ncbi:MAG: hypothetical protein WAM94_14300 [Chromatiaceae bacterium]